MVDWQVTASTIYCEHVQDEATILVYQDWSVKCTGHQKYGGSGKKRNGREGAIAACEGPGCEYVLRYKEKLMAEEAGKS